MAEDSQTPNPWISADQPIGTRSEDRLERAGYAAELARAITAWTGTHSLTIALYGAWGSGKSSLKNMVLECLRDLHKSRPTIIEFNPWRWTDQDHLISAFFSEIGKGIGRGSEQADAEKLAKSWKKYTAALEAGSSLTASIAKLLSIALGAIALLPVSATLLAPGGTLRVFLSVFTAALLLFVAGLLWSSKIVGKIANYLEAAAAAASRSPEELKAELVALLRKRKTPILVVIDDIDRLTSAQTALMFQLIKANADLPNFVYLVLFQREAVEKSLDEISHGCGAAFLEKLVQIGLDIPPVEHARLEDLLSDGLRALLKSVPDKDFDQTRWGNLYVEGLQHYFQTLRHVNRFLSSLSFYISLFEHDSVFEVDTIDLIAIETLRTFEPALYLRIRSAKELLTEGRPADRRDWDSRKAAVSQLLAAVPETHRMVAQAVLSRLFPQVEWVFGGPARGVDFVPKWLRERRICSPETFDRFFHFAVLASDISEAELSHLISVVGDQRELLSTLRSLNARGALIAALERVEASERKISLDHAVPFVTALFDIGDELPEDPPGAFIGPGMHLMRAIYQYLLRIPDPEQRLAVLRQSIRESTGLIQPLLRVETDTEQSVDEPDTALISEEGVKGLQKLCLDKIHAARQDGKLLGHPRLWAVLKRWRDWGSPEEVRKWVADMASEPSGALEVVSAFLSRGVAQRMEDSVGRETWKMDLEVLGQFADLDLLKRKLDALRRSGLPERQQRAVQAFYSALDRQTKSDGSDGSIDVDEDDDDA